MILGYTGMPPFQSPPTIPSLPERLPSHDRRTETNARLHPHRHAQNRRCPSWYAQQHSWRELGVLHISIHFPETHLVCCFFYDFTDTPTKTEKLFVTGFFRTFFTCLSFWGLLYCICFSCEPLPCFTPWSSCRPALKLFGFSSATVFDAILLHPSLLQANSRSNLLVKALNHSRSSLIHLNTVRNRKLNSFHFGFERPHIFPIILLVRRNSRILH